MDDRQMRQDVPASTATMRITVTCLFMAVLVQTLLIDTATGDNAPYQARIIKHAENGFIAGGKSVRTMWIILKRPAPLNYLDQYQSIPIGIQCGQWRLWVSIINSWWCSRRCEMKVSKVLDAFRRFGNNFEQ
jgi:hypothetical protein